MGREREVADGGESVGKGEGALYFGYLSMAPEFLVTPLSIRRYSNPHCSYTFHSVSLYGAVIEENAKQRSGVRPSFCLSHLCQVYSL